MRFLKPLTLLLVLALLAPPALAGPGDDDGDGEKGEGEKGAAPPRRLPLRALMVQPLPAPGAESAPFPAAPRLRSSAPAPRPEREQTHESERATARFPSWNLPPQVGNKGSFYANVAYGTFDEAFGSEEGDLRPLRENVPQFAGPFNEPQVAVSLEEAAALVEALDPANIPEGVTGNVFVGGQLRAKENTVNVNLGGSYNLLNSPTFSVGVGADLQFAQQNVEVDEFILNASDAQILVETSAGQLGPLPLLNPAILGILGIEPTDIPEAVALTPDQSALVPESVDSGFQAQALTLFLQAQNQLLSLRTGFQLDLGPSPEGSQQREVSDRQNALLLGLTFNYPVSPKLRVYFGADGWFTFPNEEDQRGLNGEVISGLENVEYDEGNSYATQLGADYALSFIEGLSAGAALTFRWRTRAVIEEAEVLNPGVIGDDDPDTEPEIERRMVVQRERGYNLGIGPYVNYAPPGQPFVLYLKGGVRDEYRDFTFSILGENEFAPRAGATLGAVYNF